jgi:membrane protease YdiL (CAAX protease family)
VPFFVGSSAALDPARYLLYLPAVAAGAALILWLLHRYWLSRLSPKPLSLAASRFEKILIPVLGALGLVVLCLLAPAVAGSFRTSATGWTAFDYPAGPPGAAGAAETAAVFLFQTLSEELLFRGVVMGVLGTALLFLFSHVTVHALPGEPSDSPRLAAARRRTWLLAGLLANVAQASIFTFVHRANPGVTPLASVNIGLAGFVLGWLYWSQGSLWGAWAWHFVWNFGLAAAGLPVSGVVAAPALFSLDISGARPDLVSGGPFGPEGSLICTAGLLAILVRLLVVSQRRRPEEGR